MKTLSEIQTVTTALPYKAPRTREIEMIVHNIVCQSIYGDDGDVPDAPIDNDDTDY